MENITIPGGIYLLSFAVLSDIHAQVDRLKIALEDLKEINKDYTALILNGDLVDRGILQHYNRLSNLLKDTSLVPKIIIKNIGNHEYYKDYTRGPNEWNGNDVLLTRYLNFSQRNTVYDDLWINGYHFINLGSETTYNKCVDPSTDRANISDKQISWLEGKITENYLKGRPIFVFLHQPLDDTILFSRLHHFNINKDYEIKKIFCKYPEIVYFCSHSHHNFIENGNFYRDSSGFSVVDTSSIVKPSLFCKKEVPVDSIQGIYVEVYEKEVLIRSRDFLNKQWIYSGEFTIHYGN